MIFGPKIHIYELLYEMKCVHNLEKTKVKQKKTFVRNAVLNQNYRMLFLILPVFQIYFSIAQ